MQPNDPDINPYLQQEILSASPARLRQMLIQRAEELCGFVQQLWIADEQLQASGWLLRIREILGELLEGVKDRDNPISKQVTDFYIFLLQLLTRIEQTKDPEQLKTLEELLHMENETWQKVVQKIASESNPGSAQTPFFPGSLSAESTTDYAGGFSLEI
ncbi:MAG: flagellar export chaperone FliS [Pirellulales bacterium]